MQLTLVAGPSTNLLPVPGNGGLPTTASGGAFTWTIGNVAPGSTYALKITQNGEINFTAQFSIAGGSAAVSTTSSAASVTSSAASSVTSSMTMMPTGTSSLMTSYVYYTTTVCSQSTSVQPSYYPGPSAAPVTPSNTTSVTVPVAPPAVVASNGVAPRMSSPLALVFCAVAAMVYFN